MTLNVPTCFKGLDPEEDRKRVIKFITESYMIEGMDLFDIEDIQSHYDVHREFLINDEITRNDVIRYVEVTQPGAILRDEHSNCHVRVGNHVAPAPGLLIPLQLDDIIIDARGNNCCPFELHHRYENLHPFSDGNGRSGRLLWLWQMIRFYNWTMRISFLHAWYYNSLSTYRSRDR